MPCLVVWYSIASYKMKSLKEFAMDLEYSLNVGVVTEGRLSHQSLQG